MVTLTAGVTWLGAGPAAADDCRDSRTRMGSPAAALCDELAKVRLSDSTAPLLGSESTHLALGAVRLAEHLGLTGLATAHSATGLSDLGGVVATSAMPALPALPGVTSLAGAANLLKLPALPALPKVPGKPGNYRRLANPTKVVQRPADIPVDVTAPVEQVKSTLVRRTLPQVAEALDTAKLPINSFDGVTSLLSSVSLR
ncbi:hypothetical protein [Nonomuraea sp. NPDC048826]|uniref:hypothetical protein n=1 Tax=Nonomuraea sp. NPDC048826 TaxID=3364347 RepID=UPI003710ECC8